MVVFETVYRLKSTTKAAKELHISQPAVSNHLSRIRGEINEDIFVRTPSGVEPTEVADEIYETVLSILDLCTELTNYKKEVSGFDPNMEKHCFKIGVSWVNAELLYKMVLSPLSDEYPLISFSLVSVDFSDAIDRLEDGSIDLYIGPIDSKLSSFLNSEEFFQVELKVICAKKNANFRGYRIKKSEFLENPHLRVSGGVHTSFLDNKLMACGLKQEHIHDVPDMNTAIQILEGSQYLFLVMDTRADVLLENGRQIQVLEPEDFNLPFIPLKKVWCKSSKDDLAQKWLLNHALNFRHVCED